MRDRRFTGLMFALSAITLVLFTAHGRVVLAGEEEVPEKQVEKVSVIKKTEEKPCEEEDCPDSRHHRVIVKKVGGGHEIHEMAREECNEKVIIVKGGDPGEMHAVAGHHVEVIGGDCEGEDCGKRHRIIVKRVGDSSEIHDSMKHAFEWVDDECEGEDCEKHRIILKRQGGHHGTGGHGFMVFGGGDEGDHFGWLSDHKGGFLGAQLTDLTPELRNHFGVPSDQGVMIGKVLAESAAESAGLEVGDIVMTVGEEAIGSAAELSRVIGSQEVGAAVDLGIWRSGASHNITAMLGERRGGRDPVMRRLIAHCEEGDEDCLADIEVEGLEFDCGGARECEVEVECEDGECTCTANGESIDCEELDLRHHSSDR